MKYATTQRNFLNTDLFILLAYSPAGAAGAAGPRTVSFLLLVFASSAGKNEQQNECSWRAKPSKPPCWEFVSSIMDVYLFSPRRVKKRYKELNMTGKRKSSMHATISGMANISNTP